MPTKKNGMLFEMHPSPAKSKDGKTLYYARPVKGQKLNIKQIDTLCEQHRRLIGCRLETVFEEFLKEVGYWLAKGYRIDTPIGSFAPKLGLKREISDPDDVKGSDVTFEGVEYNPGKLWKKEAEKWLDERLREILDRYVSKGGMVTARQFAAATGLTYYSARKQLDAWTEGEKPLLMRSKMGKIFIYTAI